MSGRFIDKKIYKLILENVPIPCVDVLIVHKNKFLLGKRTNKPGKDKWFMPGGRVLKGEKLIDAALRKTYEELGISLGKKSLKFLTTGETIFKDSAFDVSSHTVNSVFLVKLNKKPRLRKNYQHSQIKWFSKINKNWHPYIKNVFRIAGFK